MLCEYGCGKEGKYYFPTTKKWCCEDHFSKCPNRRKKFSGKDNPMYRKVPWNKGKTNIYSEETLHQMRQPHSTKGKTYEEIYGEEQAKILKEQRGIIFGKLNKGKSPWNKNKIGMYSKETIDQMSNNSIYTIEDYEEKYPTFIKEEHPKFENDQIKVKCKYCNKYFIPERKQLYERLRRFDRSYKVRGNSYFYCSDSCKMKCEDFNRKVDPDKFQEFKRYSALVHRETYRILKHHYTKIPNLELRGKKYGYDLDHKFSIYDGFINDIPPNYIANYKNLQIITSTNNRSKSIKSSITLNELFSYQN